MRVDFDGEESQIWFPQGRTPSPQWEFLLGVLVNYKTMEERQNDIAMVYCFAFIEETDSWEADRKPEEYDMQQRSLFGVQPAVLWLHHMHCKNLAMKTL